MIEIFGSTTSPYVRRLRMLIHGREADFRPVTLQQDLDFILKLSPIGKIPILRHGDTLVWDSRQIAHYLFQRWNLPAMNWAQENCLTALSELGDSMVMLYQMKDAGLVDRNNKYIGKQWARVERLYQFIESQVGKLDGLQTGQWNFLSMTVYSLIDWADFRQIVELKNYKLLWEWRRQHAERPDVTSTDPRLV